MDKMYGLFQTVIEFGGDSDSFILASESKQRLEDYANFHQYTLYDCETEYPNTYTSDITYAYIDEIKVI